MCDAIACRAFGSARENAIEIFLIPRTTIDRPERKRREIRDVNEYDRTPQTSWIDFRAHALQRDDRRRLGSVNARDERKHRTAVRPCDDRDWNARLGIEA